MVDWETRQYFAATPEIFSARKENHQANEILST